MWIHADIYRKLEGQHSRQSPSFFAPCRQLYESSTKTPYTLRTTRAIDLSKRSARLDEQYQHRHTFRLLRAHLALDSIETLLDDLV